MYIAQIHVKECYVTTQKTKKVKNLRGRCKELKRDLSKDDAPHNKFSNYGTVAAIRGICNIMLKCEESAAR